MLKGWAATCPPVKWVVSLIVLPWAGIMGCRCLPVDEAVGISTCKHVHDT